MVAGSLAVHRRATLVGTRTFGKDSIQGDFHLSDGADPHLTVERWLLPDERSVAGNALKPDEKISQADPSLIIDPTESQQGPVSDAQLNRALDILSSSKGSHEMASLGRWPFQPRGGQRGTTSAHAARA